MFSISGIAWDPKEDVALAVLLSRLQVDAIDVAPSKYFPSPAETTSAQIAEVRTWWKDQGISIVGMQSLMFGTTGLNIFDTPESQSAMLKHLDSICRIGGELGATRLVFGSPRNRDRSGLTDEEAHDVAVRFFRKLGDLAQKHGVLVCLEPNPACYGANFMLDSKSTAHVVRDIGHPSIWMQLDTGSSTINGEDPALVLADCVDLIGHVHLSEPQLLPIGDGATPHAQWAPLLRQYLPKHVYTVEMLATTQEPHLVAIERALQHVLAHYRQEGFAS